MTVTPTVKKHPAATTAAVAGTPATIAVALGLPNPWAALLTAATAYGPMAVLWLIKNGGIKGVWKMLFSGKQA